MGFRFAGFSWEVYVFSRELDFLAKFYYLTTYLIFSSYTAAGVSSLVEFYGIYLPSYHIITFLHVSASSWFCAQKVATEFA